MTPSISENPPSAPDTATRLPPELERVRAAAERAERLREELDAELERRGRAVVDADRAGYKQREIVAAARAGDGHATVSMIQGDLKKYL